MSAPARCAWALAGACALGGCRGSEGPVAVTQAEASLAAPAHSDRGDACADVASVRACWGHELTGEGCAGGTCVAPRTVPDAVAPAAGFRCWGAGEARRCEDRARRAGPFRCDGATCTQAHPRRPDDGEWECVELGGAAVCRLGTAPAGVVAGPPDVAWICGERRGHEGERICVDLSPDRPRGETTGWACSFERDVTSSRACVLDTVSVRLGDACSAAAACPAGASCIAGACVPAQPSPSCWVDADCGAARVCRFGSCSDHGG